MNDYIGKQSKPNHAERAVDITTIWPEIPVGDEKRKQAAAAAGAKGTSAAPMTLERRADIYFMQARCAPRPTPRQARRAAKKYRANGGAK